MTELIQAPLAPGALADRLGIDISEVSAERAVGSMPVEGNTQSFGVLHGGASCVLAETVASLAACEHFGRSGGLGVGLDLNATHHAPAQSGRVTAVASALQLGSSIASYQVAITDEAGQRICTARMTAARRRVPEPS